MQSSDDALGFLKVSIDNERHPLHRLAWLWMTGLHAPVSVEHTKGDRSDNRWVNLRLGFKPQMAGYEAPRPKPTAHNHTTRLRARTLPATL